MAADEHLRFEGRQREGSDRRLRRRSLGEPNWLFRHSHYCTDSIAIAFIELVIFFPIKPPNQKVLLL